MNFASDNAGPAHPSAMAALNEANSGYVGSYGADEITARAVAGVRDVFEAPEAAVYFVATGSAANALALGTLCAPYDAVYCSDVAHIHEDECNAPEFYTGGAKLMLVPGGDIMTPEGLNATIQTFGSAVHHPQNGAVSITNVGEQGNVYSVSQVKDLCDVAKSHDMPVHLDGARFANACARLGCSAADMSWKAGVDVTVFGGTKNGLLDVEAVVLFDPALAREFELRRKRGGHLFSKHRYLSAQMAAYTTDDLWLDLAQRSNARCDQLVAGLQVLNVPILNQSWGNLLFIDLPRGVHRAVLDKGAVYHVWGSLDGPDDEIIKGRLVCDWSISEGDVAQFLDILRTSL